MLIALLAAACQAQSPGGPEATCAAACATRATRCTQTQCARGCNLILDRLAENEGGRVLACVAASAAACDDRAWARCATRVGPHADGGPPAPPPPPVTVDLGGD